MITTRELVKMAQEQAGITSGYGLAKRLGVTPSTVYNWQKGKTTMEPEVAEKAAKIANLEPAYVVACIMAERAKDTPAAATWSRVADSVRCILCSIVGSGIRARDGPSSAAKKNKQGMPI